jgi:hypothetical protein
MPSILTSWKEIGQYLGKGVRTAQRWERESGLPVRRRENHAQNAVLAIPEELDEWVRSCTRGPTGPAAESLRREMAILRKESIELRRRVEEIEIERENDAANRANWMAMTAEAGVVARESLSRMAKRLLHTKRARAQTIRQQISFTSSLCAMGENGFGGEDFDITERARHWIGTIRACMDRPGWAPPGELSELRSQLTALELRLEAIGEGSSMSQQNRTGPPAA